MSGETIAYFGVVNQFFWRIIARLVFLPQAKSQVDVGVHRGGIKRSADLKDNIKIPLALAYGYGFGRWAIFAYWGFESEFQGGYNGLLHEVDFGKCIPSGRQYRIPLRFPLEDLQRRQYLRIYCHSKGIWIPISTRSFTP